MKEQVEKAIAAIEALNLYDGDDICLSLIQKVIKEHVTFLDWKQRKIIDRLPPVGEWAMVYRKYQGEGYVTFEKWKVVDSKVFHDFIMKHSDECEGLGLGDAWFNFPKPLTVIAIERDSFHHGKETRRKIALARLRFVEDWLAKN